MTLRNSIFSFIPSHRKKTLLLAYNVNIFLFHLFKNMEHSLYTRHHWENKSKSIQSPCPLVAPGLEGEAEKKMDN
jgi:hypothetical protein